jgi:predicted aspartyl protease
VRTSTLEFQATEIPIKLYQGYLIVTEGRVGNLEHQHLVLDTGTNPSMIDAKVSAKLGLQSNTRSLALLNKNVASKSVILPDLQFGPLRRQNLEVMVADFSRIASGLGTSIDAVIGLDVLGAMSFTIDYANRCMFFRASMEPHTAPFTAGQQFITVNLKSGGRQLNLLFDTGTPRLVLFENHLGGVDYARSDATGRGQNVSGNVEYKTIVLQQARIGSQEVGPQRAAVVANRKDIESEWDGLIGISCLSFLRPGWFMENSSWDVAPAMKNGLIQSFLQPLDKAVPMVATADIGRVAAELIQTTWNGRKVVELEAPRRVTPQEIAATFADLLGRPVSTEAVPRETWESLFKSQGMKNPMPRIQMLDGFNQGWIEFESGEAGSRKGKVELRTVLQKLIKRASKS